jgi:hypothetical protein
MPPWTARKAVAIISWSCAVFTNGAVQPYLWVILESRGDMIASKYPLYTFGYKYRDNVAGLSSIGQLADLQRQSRQSSKSSLYSVEYATGGS